MKKVFIVKAEHCDYDQYYRIAVVADSSKEALEIVKKKEYFSDNQGEVTAEEIDMAKSGVILSSSSFCPVFSVDWN